jgi:hypothetical protein
MNSHQLDQFFATNRPPVTHWRIPSTYTARQIVYAVEHAKLHPDDTYTTPDEVRLTAADFILWFRKCLHAKISASDPRIVSLKGARKLSSAYSTSLYRDSQRLKGYGGFGKILETPNVRQRLNADHVHFFWGGGHLLCDDRNCEHRH